MENDFFTWITQEIKKRGWTDSELSRRAGMSPAALSLVFSEQRKVSLSFCKGIARAFGEPPEKVMRLAGLLSPVPQPAQNEDQLLDIFRRLGAAQQGFLLDAARGVGQQQDGPFPASVLREQGEVYVTPDEPDRTAIPTATEIMDGLEQLDEPERYFVYDYIKWRLEQRERWRVLSRKPRYSSEEIDRFISDIPPASQQGLFLNALIQLNMLGFDISAIGGGVLGNLDIGKETGQ